MPFDVNSNPVRIAIGAALLVIGLLLGWFGHKAIDAPADVATARQYDDWRVLCPKQSDRADVCGLQQMSELVQLQIFRAKGAASDQMFVTVPLGVLLDPGIGVQLTNNDKFSASDKPKLYSFETCTQSGCLVRVPVDDAFMKALLSAKQGRILVLRIDGKAAGLPFSLKGFADAHKAFEVDAAQRRSWWKRLWS